MNTTASALAADQALHRDFRLKRRLAALLVSPLLQIAGSLIAGVLGAALLRHQFIGASEGFVHETTAIGTSLAVLAGLVIYRKVTSLPGTEALINTLPAFALSYTGVAALLSVLRIDFSRHELIISFALTMAFMMVLGMVAARAQRPSFGYVPGGSTDDLIRVSHVNWIEVASPTEAAGLPDLPLVADLQSDALGPDWERFLAEAAIAGRRVFNTPQLRESLVGKVRIGHLSENSFGHLAPDSIYAPLKFYLDILAAFLALALLSPLLILTAAAIRLESPGPAIFRQERMGYRGRSFTIYKFRSMRAAPDRGEELGADMTKSDDERITPIGRFIRKTRIDELPQLINILRGEMSWIGPRPETLRLSRWYEDQIPFYRYRHIVRPGITGWAQVKQGHVTSVTDVNDKLEYDFFYVKRFSIWLDLLIVAHTVRVMLTGFGAR
jgi:lipopolysaccharide/colanic/teichoic acid biosynthesis glycosyltransferase